MRHASSLVLVAAVFGSAATLQAQERMNVLAFEGGGSGQAAAMADIDVGVAAFGAVRHVTGIAIEPRASATLTAVAGGRYLVWVTPRKNPNDPGQYAIFDRRTRAFSTIATPVYWGLLGDRIRPRVFLLKEPVTVYDFRTGVERVAAPTREAGWESSGVAYAARADRLAFLERQVTATEIRLRVTVVDVATAAPVGMVTLPPAPSPLVTTALDIADDGTLIYVRDPATAGILAYDVALGTEVARSAVSGSVVIDHDRQLLLVQSSPGLLTVLDARTLQTLGALTVAAGADSFQVIPGRGVTGAYVLRSRITGPSSCVVDLDVLNVGGQRRSSTRLSDTLNGLSPWCVAPFAGAVITRNPAPPAGLTAQVAGRTVTLSWETAGDTTDFELEVGVSPGTTSLRVAVGEATAIGAAGVAPGTYYVRVRARNEVGPSGPSTELRVDVP